MLHLGTPEMRDRTISPPRRGSTSPSAGRRISTSPYRRGGSNSPPGVRHASQLPSASTTPQRRSLSPFHHAQPSAVALASAKQDTTIMERDLLHERDECERLRQRSVALQRELSTALDGAAESERRALRAQKQTDTLRAELEEAKERERNVAKELEKSRRKSSSLMDEVSMLKGHNDTLNKELVNASSFRAERSQLTQDHLMKLEKASILIENLQQQVAVGQEQLSILRGEHSNMEERLRIATIEMDRVTESNSQYRDAVQREVEFFCRCLETMANGSDSDERTMLQELLVSPVTGEASGLNNLSTSPARERGVGIVSTSVLQPKIDMEVRKLFQFMRSAIVTVEGTIQQATSKAKAVALKEQMHQSQWGQLDEDLKNSLKENATLSARHAASEVETHRLHTELQSATRELNMLKKDTDHKLMLLGEALGCLGEWAAVETQSEALLKERDGLRIKCSEQSEKLGRLKAQMDDQWREQDAKLQQEIIRIRREIEDRANEVRTDVETRMEAKAKATARANRDTSRQMSSRLEALEASAIHREDAFTTGMLDVGEELDMVKLKYAESLKLIKSLEERERKWKMEYEAVNAKMETLKAGLAVEKSRQLLLQENTMPIDASATTLDLTRGGGGNEGLGLPAVSSTASLNGASLVDVAHSAATANTTMSAPSHRPDAASPAQMLILTLRVLAGSWEDHRELIAQRSVLMRQLQQVDVLLRSIPHQTPAAVQPIMRFRKVAIVAMAAARLRNCAKNTSSRVIGSPLRGAPRVRLNSGVNNAVHSIIDAQHGGCLGVAEGEVERLKDLLVLPNKRDLASNPVIALQALVDSVDTNRTLPTQQSGLNLCDALQDGLSRVVVSFGRKAAPLSATAKIAAALASTPSRQPEPSTNHTMLDQQSFQGVEGSSHPAAPVMHHPKPINNGTNTAPPPPSSTTAMTAKPTHHLQDPTTKKLPSRTSSPLIHAAAQPYQTFQRGVSPAVFEAVSPPTPSTGAEEAPHHKSAPSGPTYPTLWASRGSSVTTPTQQQSHHQQPTPNRSTSASAASTTPRPNSVAPVPSTPNAGSMSTIKRNTTSTLHTPYTSVAVGTPDGPSDEFTLEVLNVIKALDTRIAGALRRSGHNMMTAAAAAGDAATAAAELSVKRKTPQRSFRRSASRSQSPR